MEESELDDKLMEIKKAKLKEEFFERNIDRLRTFHQQYPDHPVPIRWSNEKQDYVWVTMNRATRKRLITLTDE